MEGRPASCPAAHQDLHRPTPYFARLYPTRFFHPKYRTTSPRFRAAAALLGV